MRRLSGVLIAVGLLIGCERESRTGTDLATPGSGSAATPLPAGHPPVGSGAPKLPSGERGAAAKAEGTLSGKVLETMDSGGYTYLRLGTTGGERWAAVPETPVTVGAEVHVLQPFEMYDFPSKTLNRTFPQIAFGKGLELAGAAGTGGAKAGHPGGAQPTTAEPIKVEKAPGPDGRTVAEIFAERKKLAGKPVAVRGKVAKFSTQILGRNWIHLEDGTGSPAEKNHAVVVTTEETVKVGDVVTVRGKLTLDKDIGSGYVYAVLIEDAAIVRAP